MHAIAEGAAQSNPSITSGTCSTLDHWLLQVGKMRSETKSSQKIEGEDSVNLEHKEDETMKLPIAFQEPVGIEGWSNASTTLDSLPEYASSSMDSLPSPREFMGEHSQPDMRGATSSLDENSCRRSVHSVCRSIHGPSVTFSDCIEVHEFSPEPCVSPGIVTGSTWSGLETADDEEEEEQEQDIMQNILPKLGMFGKAAEGRNFRRSVTANVGFQPSNMGSLTVERSGLWRRRRLSNDSTRVQGKPYSVLSLT